MTWQVVVPDRLAPPADVEQAVFGDTAEVIVLGAKQNDELSDRVAGADAILAWHDLRWDAAQLAAMPRCKVIVRVGVGFDNVDLEAARARGIVVCNVPDYGTNDVADHAMALLLAVARGLPGHDRAVRTGPSEWRWGVTPTFRLTDKLLGIVGLGRIGSATALRAKAFGMRVGYYDPYRPAGWDKTLGVTRFHTLAELARAADVISLHTPLTPETHGLLSSEIFGVMRRGSVVINTARGPVVDWPAFCEAFDSGVVAGAGFDVLPVEPLDRSDPLLRAWLADEPRYRDRLVITPHAAFYSLEAMVEMRRKAAEEAFRVLRGEPPLNRVG